MKQARNIGMAQLLQEPRLAHDELERAALNVHSLDYAVESYATGSTGIRIRRAG